MSDVRTETDGLGRVDVPADKLWGAQTQRSLQHFSIGRDLMQLGYVDETTFDRVVDPAKMVKPYGKRGRSRRSGRKQCLTIARTEQIP